MQKLDANSVSDQIDSFVAWWKLAGVDHIVEDEPANWLQPAADTGPEPVSSPDRVTEAAKTAPPPLPTAAAYATYVPVAEWPNDLEILKQQIAAKIALPGNQYGGNPVIPVGQVGSKLMVISDIPEMADVDAGHFGTGAIGALLTNMVNTIGFEIDQCYICALATTRPATGELPENDGAALRSFMHHQIEIIGPDRVMIFGSSACKVLLDINLIENHQTLLKINQEGSKKAAIATYHPRSLLARPILKAQAWKDLQMFAKEDAL